MVTVIAFLCALSLSPAQCGRNNAVDVITLPATDDEESCLRDAQMTLAGLAIQPDAGHRWVIKCGRGNQGRGPVG